MTKSGIAGNMGGMLRFISYQVTFNDLAATSGSGAKAVALEALPVGSVVQYTIIKHSVAFAGGSLSAMTASVGVSGGSATAITSALDAFATVSATALVENKSFLHATRASITPIVTFTPTGDNCSAATAGVLNVDILVYWVTTPVVL